MTDIMFTYQYSLQHIGIYVCTWSFNIPTVYAYNIGTILLHISTYVYMICECILVFYNVIHSQHMLKIYGMHSSNNII